MPSTDSMATGASEARAEIDGLLDSQRQLTIELAMSGRESRQFGQALSRAFVGLAVQGKGLGEVLRQLALSLSRLALGAAFKPLEGLVGGMLQSIVSGAGGGGPAGTGMAAGFVPSGRIAAPAMLGFSGDGVLSAAAGGRARTAIGEGGTAGFRPAGTAGPTVVLNIATPDVESFRRSETQLAALLARAVGQGQRNL
ncbi:MAG: phage tail tape measure protein [Hyphomicrobiaceae bacterium]|nr:phage tail tape measure protein [Hyphomicrobiaceae bacterium]